MDIQKTYDVIRSRKDEVIKPGMTVLVPCVLLCWAVCACVYLYLFNYKDENLEPWAFAASGATAFCIAFYAALAFAWPQAKRFKTCVLVLAFCLTGVSLGISGAAHVAGFNPQNQLDKSKNSVFVLAEDAQVSTLGYKAKAVALIDAVADTAKDASGATYANIAFAQLFGNKATVTLYLPQNCNLLEGSIVYGQASYSSVSDSYAQSMWQSGITYSATLDTYEQIADTGPLGALRGLRARAIELFETYGGSQAGILQALVCGYKNTIKDNGIYDNFKTCGLAHLVAVSGAHLAIVSAAFCSILKFAGAKRKVVFVMSAAFVCAYLVFAGIPISAIRASIMILISSSAWLFARRSASLNALMLCIFAFLVLDPVSSVSVSLFLSAGSTLGIILFAGLIASWMPCKNKIVADGVVAPVSLTLASNLETQPFSAALFSQLPLIAPIANIVAAPLFTIACTAGLMCIVLAMALQPAAPFFIAVASALAWPLEQVVNLLSALPYASIAVAANAAAMIALSAVASIILWKWYPKIKAFVFAAGTTCVCVCCAALIFIAPTFAATDYIKMLDVGQGDSTLLASGGANVLIDTGNKDSMLRDAIGSSGVYTIDAVLITHADSDHCASLDSLATYTNILSVYVAADMYDCTCSNCTDLIKTAKNTVGEGGVYGIHAGDILKFGKYTLKVLSPSAFEDEGGNADSLVVLASWDFESDGEPEWQALFTGDAEADVLYGLARSGLVGDIDILKVPHHGSKAGMTSDLLGAIKPEVALIGVGATNRYGHPTQTALDLLQEVGAAVYRTDINSNITIELGKEKMKISTDAP